MLRSSGQTLDFQNWDIDAKSASTLTLEAVDLNPNYWIHITEVSCRTDCVYYDESPGCCNVSRGWPRVPEFTEYL